MIQSVSLPLMFLIFDFPRNNVFASDHMNIEMV